MARDLQDDLAEHDRSDELLLKQGRRGNEEAFLALYQRHSGPVFRFALHMSGSRETAEEVLQETFVALLEQKTGFDARRGSLEGYLIGVARNQVRRRLLAISREQQAGLDALRQTAAEDHPESELELLREAIVALPENYRAVTVLCELEEISYLDAAQQLGCAVGTVRSRLHRAKTLLAAKLLRRNRCPVTSKK